MLKKLVIVSDKDNILRVQSPCCKGEVIKGDLYRTNQVVLSCKNCHVDLYVFDTEEEMNTAFGDALDHFLSKQESPKTGP